MTPNASHPPSSRPASWPRRHLLLAGGLLLAGVAQARTVGSGTLATETRAVTGFDAIAVGGSIDLVVRQGSSEALTLSGDDNLLSLVETVVEGGARGRTLHIRPQRNSSFTTRLPITATVDVVALRALASAGSGDLRVGALKTPSLRLAISGSGAARFENLSADQLEVRLAGSGNVNGAGNVATVKVTIAGSGDVDLSALVADEVTVSVAGSGDARVTANKSLSATVAGSGDVVYGGSASTIRSTVAGSGTISRR